VLDVALHARGSPVSAKALAGRLDVGPRHLEAVLQHLVRAGILKGVRGPRGGYELGRERRRISVGEVVRAVERIEEPEPTGPDLIRQAIAPAIAQAAGEFLAALDRISIDELCRAAGPAGVPPQADFTI
jgi:Rrf2 family protein